MTKKVIIENACSYPVPVMVQPQVVGVEGQWVNDGPPISLREIATRSEQFIHQNRRVVVFELPMSAA
jgi:hypothetical protein